MTITTPTVRGATRRWAFWIVAAVILLLIAVGTVLFTGAAGIAGDPLSATNAAPAGSKALAEVLRQQGVTVTATTSLAATEAAITDPDDTTLFLFDPNGHLDAQQYNRVKDLAASTVLMSPGFQALAALAPGVAQAGTVPDAPLDGGLRGAGGDAGRVGLRRRQRVPDHRGRAGDRVPAAAQDAVFSLVRLTDGARSVTVLGTQDAFSQRAYFRARQRGAGPRPARRAHAPGLVPARRRRTSPAGPPWPSSPRSGCPG